MQRMIVMSPEIFSKFSKLFQDDKNLDLLDQKMKKVLYDKKLKPLQKWYLYRQNLLKYGINKRHAKKLPEKANNLTFDTGTQTKFFSKRNAYTETQLPKYKSTSAQTNFVPLVTDEVFEYDPKKEHSDMDIDLTHYDLDDENSFRKLAQTEMLKDEKLVQRPSLSTDYRMFETPSGDVITVAVPSPEKKKTLRSAGSSISSTILSQFPETKKTKIKTFTKKSQTKNFINTGMDNI